MAYTGASPRKPQLSRGEKEGTAESQPDNDKREFNGFDPGLVTKDWSRAALARKLGEWLEIMDRGRPVHPPTLKRYPRLHKGRIQCLQGGALGGQTTTTTQQRRDLYF
jgi:hypothetical protein